MQQQLLLQLNAASVNNLHLGLLEIFTPSPAFTIQFQKWESVRIEILFCLIVQILILVVAINFFSNRNKQKKLLRLQYELVRAERQRISGEIHDNIGSRIFAIHLFAEMESKKLENVIEIKQLSSMIYEMSNKIKEIIWSTNIENDNIENLIYFIQFQSAKMFENSEITFTSTIPDDIIDLNIYYRNDIYLVVNELLHNALKHSKATNISLKIAFIDSSLVFFVKDNGIGFNPNKIKTNSMGLENIKSRIEKIKGELTIENNQGTLTTVKVPLAHISLDYSTPKKRNKFLFWKLQKSTS